MRHQMSQLTKTYLIRDEEDFADENHDWHIVLWILQFVIAKKSFKNWEENLDKLVQILSLIVNLKLKCLDNALQGSQPRHLISLIIACESLMDCLLSNRWSPSGILQLGYVVDDVLDAWDHNFSLFVVHVHHWVQCIKDICLQKALVPFQDYWLLELLLCIQVPHVLLILA